MTREEDGSISAFGVTFKGAAVKLLFQNSGWLVAVGCIIFVSVGPPRQILDRLTKLETKADEQGKQLDRIENRLNGRGLRAGKPITLADLKMNRRND